MQPTVELDNVILCSHPEASCLDSWRVDTLSDSLAFADNEDGYDRNAEEDENDDEGSESPTEVHLSIK